MVTARSPLDEFSKAPQPKDSKLSAADAFAKLDTDASGSLSLAEFKAGAPPAPSNGGQSGGQQGGQQVAKDPRRLLARPIFSPSSIPTAMAS